MQILSECNLSKLVVEILDGKTIIFPTETTYGLGCDASNQTAVDKIFAIKGRRPDKPLLVVVPTVVMAREYLVWNDTLEKIAQQYWPGPLTVVGEYKNGSKKLARGVVAANNTVAIRVTKFDLTKSITEKINRPLVATSANLSDAGDCYDARACAQSFEGREAQPDIILNYGVLPTKPPTTIVSVIGEPRVIRQGELKVEL